MSSNTHIDDYEYKKTVEFLHGYLKESSKYIFSRYCRGTNLFLTDIKKDSDNILSEEMSIILLWGTLGTIILKTHFNLDSANYFATGELKVLTDENKNMSRDFMKEFSNMQAGHIRGIFEENKIMLGMSLPFLVLGKDEKLFRKIRDADSEIYLWKLEDENKNTLSCAVEFCLNDYLMLKNISSALQNDIEKNNSAERLEAEGDVVFL